jgi:hypothetical protein
MPDIYTLYKILKSEKISMEVLNSIKKRMSKDSSTNNTSHPNYFYKLNISLIVETNIICIKFMERRYLK